MLERSIFLLFDRDQEYAADHIGLMLMAKAGYDPRVAIAFWKRAKEILATDSIKLGAFFSTHPAASDRVKALEKALPESLKYFEQR